MKAYLSYELRDKDLPLVTLLAKELAKREFVLNGTIHNAPPSYEVSKLARHTIKNADLFIGILTGDGHPRTHQLVYQEWDIAVEYNKPRIFLIENTIQVDARFKESYITFDRNQPSAIQQELQSLVKKHQKDAPGLSATDWLMVVGGLTLIGLLGAMFLREKSN